MASSITLPDQVEEIAERLVASGRYANVGEVVLDGVRRLEERHDERDARVAWLREAIQEGLASGPAQPLDMDEIKQKAKRRLMSGGGR